MLYDLNQIILVGGVTHCTKEWGKMENSSLDECIKIYLPLDGEAKLFLGDKTITLSPNKVYLINGEKITGCECEYFMDVAWVHFIPASLQLKYILLKYLDVEVWEYPELPITKDLLHLIGHIYVDNRDALEYVSEQVIMKKVKQFNIPNDATLCMLQSILVYMIGRYFEKEKFKSISEEFALFSRLSAAIEYMDQSFKANPFLKDIASKVFMSPNSFLRLFKNSFNMTPFEYMLYKRVALAQQLLTTTKLSVKEIALKCGYDNQFYFSRIFKKRLGASPSDYRFGNKRCALRKNPSDNS